MIFINKRLILIIELCIAIILFATVCLWQADTLMIYLMIGFFVAAIVVLLVAFTHVSLVSVFTSKFFLWLSVCYALILLNGIYRLKVGTFNWDFLAFSYVLSVLLLLLFKCVPKNCNLVFVFAKACRLALLFSIVYMLATKAVDLSNITFGFRFGEGLSGNANTIATSLGLLTLPVLYLICKEKKKLFNLSVWGVSTVIGLITGSKKSLIFIALSFVLIFMLYKNATKYLIAPFIIAVGVYALLNVPILYNTVGFRLVDALASFGIGSSVTNATSTEARYNYVKLGINSFLSVPFWGGGMNYFQYVNNLPHYSHNNYVELLNSFGLTGFVLFYSIPVACFKKLWQLLRSMGSKKELEILFATLFLLCQLLLDIGMVSFSSMCTYYLAYVLVAEVLERRKFEKNTDHSPVAGVGRS